MVRNREKVSKEFGPTDSDLHLAMAIRSLADESRCLSLMSRYESRLQRVHDKAYAALRELQQLRASQPSVPTPTEPEPTPAGAPDPTPKADNPSVSAEAFVENEISREPTTQPDSSPGIHFLPSHPASKNREFGGS